MKDFEDSTLWRISAFDRLRVQTGQSGFARLGGNTTLPSTMHAELSTLAQRRGSHHILEVVAICLRQRESALLLLRHAGLVWPVTLFPRSHLYHVPRSLLEALQSGAHDLQLIDVEPPGLRPPGHVMHERIAEGPGYRPLGPLLWALALRVPQGILLNEISGRAAYRLTADVASDGALSGAMGAALIRLRTQIASLSDIARWPGMDTDRAARLLNGAYLQGGLIVLRTHAAARPAQSAHRGLMGWIRNKR